MKCTQLAKHRVVQQNKPFYDIRAAMKETAQHCPGVNTAVFKLLGHDLVFEMRSGWQGGQLANGSYEQGSDNHG